MGRTRSHNTLRSQMITSINNSFCPGVSKRNDKLTGQYLQMTKVYSYADKKALTDTAKDFSKYIKENHPTIKYMKDVNKEVVKGFLASKTKTCTTNTIKGIASRLNKISQLGSSMYNRKIDWKINNIPKGKESLRTIAMKESDYQKIIDSQKDCYGKMAVELSHAFGLRVSECVNIRPIDIQRDTLTIYKSKGGKTRVLPIETNEQRKIIDKIKKIVINNKTADREKIIPIKSASANKWLNSRCKKIGIATYNSHKTSFHSIRKNWAIREYNKELTKYNKKVAWSHVCVKLGHGENREDLRKVYLPNIK